MPTKLDLFLNGNPNGTTDKDREGRKVTEKDKPFNIWSFDNKRKWFIHEDDRSEFYRLYCADLRKSIPQFLTERSTPIGQMRVDLDFKYEGRVEEHKHTQEQVMKFVDAYLQEARRWVIMPDIVEVYILEKEYPTFDPIKKISSSGIHIQIPDIKTRADVEKGIRRALLQRMESFFPNLNLMKGWDDVYDPSALTHTGNWPLLGSKKPAEGSLPYELKYVIDWENGEMSIDDQVSPTPTLELVHKLSVRSAASDETPLTEYGQQNTRTPAEPATLRAVSRGRTDTREEQGSRGASPSGRVRADLAENRKKNIRAHVMNLAEFRHSGPHDEYIKVGQCLFNIHPYDLEDVWLDFMEKSSDDKRKVKAREKWRGFTERVDGERTGEGSLRFWSRQDNFEEYLKIESENVDSLVREAAATATEHDVAQVVYAKYRDEFKCASVKNNDWYQYVGHIWKSSESGVDLLARLSSDISKIFLIKEREALNAIEGLDPERDKEAAEIAERDVKSYHTIRLKLKTTSFKENVMRECRVLFRDPKFLENLDNNKHLLAFTNGVFDTQIRTFRPGKPDDYISFCTNVPYPEDAPYHTHKCWDEINRFLASILPNPLVRIYFLMILASCLSGETNQRFHIMTGSGSNGKSMLMKLMLNAMGDYGYAADIAIFTQKRGQSGAAAPQMVRMRGRRFVTMSEPDEGEPLASALLKFLTGCDKITVRDLYAGSKQMVEFEIMCKFMLSCNEKPPVRTVDGGTWRRIKVVDFPNKFVHEPKLPNEHPIDETIMEKTGSAEWAACFMAYLVHLYLEEIPKHPGLVPPKEVDVFTSEYKNESDVIAQFIDEHVHARESTDEITNIVWTNVSTAFQEWKRRNEMARGSAPDLKKRLEERFGKYPKNGWTSFRFGAA
jgi:P4 family phage/plasmid primase-like protien